MSGTFQGLSTLQFTPDNKFAYAYSGLKLVSGAKTTIMEFETGSFYLIGEVSIQMFSDTTDDIEYVVDFNDITIMEMNTTSFKDYAPYQPVPIIIPPFTKVTFSGLNTATSSSKNVGINLTAKTGGTIEQFDLRLKSE